MNNRKRKRFDETKKANGTFTKEDLSKTIKKTQDLAVEGLLQLSEWVTNGSHDEVELDSIDEYQFLASHKKIPNRVPTMETTTIVLSDQWQRDADTYHSALHEKNEQVKNEMDELSKKINSVKNRIDILANSNFTTFLTLENLDDEKIQKAEKNLQESIQQYQQLEQEWKRTQESYQTVLNCQSTLFHNANSAKTQLRQRLNEHLLLRKL